MSEYGGFIDMEHYFGGEYHKNAIRLNSGRNCLAYLIETYNIKKILLPYYICDSVINVCKKYNCEINYYNINENLKPIINDIEKNEYIYIVNYFGQLSNKEIKKYKHKFKNVIIDNVQDFFRKPLKNIDTIYSCRKFFGTTDGGYLYTNKRNPKVYEIDKSKQRLSYLFGRYENTAEEYYNNYLENEVLINDLPIRQMSKITNNILKSINYYKVKKIRSKNFKYLNKNLYNDNNLKLKNVKGAYIYPYYITNGNILKTKLIQNNIFVPTLWPNVENKEYNMFEYDVAMNTIFLPVDQRYNISDMKKIIEILKENKL